MTINGKRDDFVMADFQACGRAASMKRGRAETIVREVQTIVSGWKGYAEEAGVPASTQEQIQRTLRLQNF